MTARVQISNTNCEKYLFYSPLTNNDDPNYIIQVGSVFGSIISLENIL